MNYVFDSSSLIYLGKLKVLEKIKLLGRGFIPKKVYKEVVEKGFQRGELEAKYIRQLIKNNQFIIKGAKANISSIIETPILSEADKEVILLAKETKAIAITDDRYAKQIAQSIGVKSHGSLYVILKLVEKKEISKKEAINYVDKMIKLGFYLSTEKYKEVLYIINKI